MATFRFCACAGRRWLSSVEGEGFGGVQTSNCRARPYTLIHSYPSLIARPHLRIARGRPRAATAEIPCPATTSPGPPSRPWRRRASRSHSLCGAEIAIVALGLDVRRALSCARTTVTAGGGRVLRESRARRSIPDLPLVWRSIMPGIAVYRWISPRRAVQPMPAGTLVMRSPSTITTTSVGSRTPSHGADMQDGAGRCAASPAAARQSAGEQALSGG